MSRNAESMRDAGNARKGSGRSAPSSTRSEIFSSIWRVNSSSPWKTASIATTWNDALLRSGRSGNARILVDVALADLDEATELREAGKPHRDRFAGERVQNHIHALAVGQIHHGLGKIAAARIDHVFHAERFEQSAFAWAARGGDDFRPKMKRDLDRGHSDTARAGMDENALALAQSRRRFAAHATQS